MSARSAGGFAADFGAQASRHVLSERGGGFAADAKAYDERFLAEQFCKFLAAIEGGGFEKEDGERRGRIEIFCERIENFVASLVAEILDRFGVVHDDHLARGEHGNGLGALEDFVPAGAAAGEARHGPVARALGNERLDDLIAAHFAQVGVRAEENNSGDGFAARQAFGEFVGRDFGHQKFSSTSATTCEAKSRDMRSSAGSCSSKKLFTSGEI